MKKVFKIINTLFILIFSSISLTACVAGVVSEKQYIEFFSGVDAIDEHGNSVFYEMKTLVDNIEFNTNIQSKSYCKLDVYLKQSCQIKGVVFLVRSSKKATYKFTTCINEMIVSTNIKEINENSTTIIELFFNDTYECKNSDEFYIEIEELNLVENEEKSKFVFDSLIVFLQEK